MNEMRKTTCSDTAPGRSVSGRHGTLGSVQIPKREKQSIHMYRSHTKYHDTVRYAIYNIIRDARRAIVRKKTGFLPSSIPRGWGGRVDLVISEPTRGHTLLDVVRADPTRVDLVARAIVITKHAASKAARLEERHFSGRLRGDTFVPIAIETYGALLSQTYEFLRDCSRRAFSENGESSPSTSVLVTWFR